MIAGARPAWLRAELEAAGRDFLLVSGDFPQRLRLAVDAVEGLIKLGEVRRYSAR